MTKLFVNGREQDVDLQLDKLFVKINGEYYVKTINIEKQILSELEEWLEEESKKSDLKGCSFEQTYLTGKWNAYNKSLNKIQELKEKYK